MPAGGYDLRPRQLRALLILLILLPLLPSAVIVRFFADASRYERSTLGESWRDFYTSYAKALAGYSRNQSYREFEDAFDEAESSPVHLAQSLSARADVDSVLLFDRSLAPGGQVWKNGLPDDDADATALMGMIGSLRPPQNHQALWRSLQGTGMLARILEGDSWWIVILRTPAVVESKLNSYLEDASGSDITWKITTSIMPPIFPSNILGQGPVSHSLDAVAEGWTLWVGPDEYSARMNTGLGEQIRLYQQVSILVLGAVLTVGILAGWAITRQIRLQDIRSSALAAVAHELKTPIASSKLLIETLQSNYDQTDSCPRDYIRLLGIENERLANVASDFLLFSRIEQKRYQPKREPVAVHDIIREALASVHSAMHEAAIQVTTHLPETQLRVLGEQKTLTRALVNLLENAIKYSGDKKSIEVSARQAGARSIEISISDRGIGIPPRELRRIFKPFHQANNKLSRSHEGTGLGLSIVKQIITAHHGQIWAESDGHSGATFTIRLPSAAK